MPAFKISLAAWGGAAGRTLIQGLRIHTPSGTRIIHQADDVAGQAEQNIVFRAHTSANKYLGAVTCKGAGHGSSVGLESTGNDTMRLWFGHATKRVTGYVNYTVGQTGTVSFISSTLPEGDVSVDQDANLLCLRNGNRYRGYKLSSVSAGQPSQLWDFTIEPWGKRFQGHLVWRGCLFVHRDIETKGQSMAHQFDLRGRELAKRDTTSLGDEAEGLVAIDDTVHIVKRTGGNNAKRVVEVTPWLVIPDPKGDDVKPTYVLWRGVRVNPGSVPSLDKLAEVTGQNIRVSPTQGGFNRGGVVASAGTHDGGAAMDLSVNGMSSAQIATTVRLARECGWAAWYRPYVKGLWPRHIHMIRVGDSTASAGAKAQVTAYRRGRDGLAGNGKDTGPTVLGANGEKFPTWAQSKWNPVNKPKTLADVIAELGAVKDVSVSAINKARSTGKPSRHVAQMQAWLNLAIPADPLTVDGIWSAAGPTQRKLDAFRRSLGWTGKDTTGEVGPHSLTLLHDAVKATLPVREKYPTK